MISNPGLPRHEARILDTWPARSISRFRLFMGLRQVVFGNFKLVCVFLVRISLGSLYSNAHYIHGNCNYIGHGPSYDGLNIFTCRSTTSLAMISTNNPSGDPFLYNTPLEGWYEITASPNICFSEYEDFVRIIFMYVTSKLRLYNADRSLGTS